MSRIARIAVFIAALTSLFAMMSTTAGAATWHASGSSTLHATSGPGTLSSTGAGLACPTGTATGTVTPTAVVPVGAWSAVHGTVTWLNCTLGVTGYAVECGYTLTAFSWTAGSPAVTHGLADITCGVYLQGAKFCHLEGSVHGHYTNPTATVPGSLTLTTTGSNVVVTNGPNGTCPLGNGDTGHLTEFTFNLTNVAGSPTIERTA